MTDDLRALAIKVREMVGHHPFDHDRIVDEKRCAECRVLKAFDVALVSGAEGGEEKPNE